MHCKQAWASVWSHVLLEQNSRIRQSCAVLKPGVVVSSFIRKVMKRQAFLGDQFCQHWRLGPCNIITFKWSAEFSWDVLCGQQWCYYLVWMQSDGCSESSIRKTISWRLRGQGVFTYRFHVNEMPEIVTFPMMTGCSCIHPPPKGRMPSLFSWRKFFKCFCFGRYSFCLKFKINVCG